MIRIEIIANHSVEDNILEALATEGAGKLYTRFPGVYGVGRQGPRMGDAIWPEENFALVIWCDSAEAAAIERAVRSVKERFPNEGIKLFGLPDPLGLPPPAFSAPGVPAGTAPLSPAVPPGAPAPPANTAASAPAPAEMGAGPVPVPASAADSLDSVAVPAPGGGPVLPPAASRPDFGGESF